ncbi:hypothetical protein ILYODFUR_031429 [Ilyodon furcidens]|uniref:Uncharacterized protein n=1 Tax=Ilyodon furcidens TaxID=33524 RepID=A0ABV0VIQ1_9TELE
MAVRLRLLSSLRIHPTFHISQIKPVFTSSSCPPAKPPPTPWTIWGTWCIRSDRSWTPVGRVVVGSTSSTGRATVLRTVLGCPSPLSVTRLSSEGTDAPGSEWTGVNHLLIADWGYLSLKLPALHRLSVNLQWFQTYLIQLPVLV